MKNKRMIIGVSALLAFSCGAVPQTCQATALSDTITLQGVVTANCSIAITDESAALTLPLAVTGAQRIKVGTILQNCNKKTGYSLTVASANCATLPAGAKVLDTVSAGVVAYSVEFNNPTTGGSLAIVPSLLANTCAAVSGRTVAGALIVAENSTVYVNYTGSLLLAAGTYNDTLTITMNLN